ncbi:hypothetical protein HZI73_06370 [Vallitalea pronyensis]|uniref:Uncharacterized protein n=1 Tax=Vallitalea pronyensis TaxID=1348613 RepID=A0A8J8MIK8_9FIRM|nr:hypothetical protein [Vallitalea pronyensis]QUI21948.1 hypothetical protein HZI73_06370 [Vallitalea pronyensis]
MNLLKKIKALFQRKLEHIDEKNYLGVNIQDVYNDADNTYKVCQQLISAKRDKERVVQEYEKNVKKYSGIQQIEGLPKKTLAALEKYAHTYMDTSKHKDEYVNRIKGVGEELNYLEDYDEDIPHVIENIRHIEDKQRAVKNDIHSIEGEKAELGYKALRLVKTQKAVKILMIILLMVFALSAFILATLYKTNDIDIMIPSITMMVIIGFFGMWIYIFRRYVAHEMKKNNMLRQRAVELLNKIKVKYVHHEQFLAYAYKKYKVKSGDMLEERYHHYHQNQQDKHHIHHISRNIISAEEDIGKLLSKHQVEVDDPFFDDIQYHVSKTKRHAYKQEIENNIKTLRNTMDEYDKEILLITKLLEDVKEKDDSNDKAISKMIERLNLS